MFISNVVLSWKPVVESFSYASEDWEHSYSFFCHSEKLLSYATENHFLIDAISNLKRAVDHRIKHIAKTYKLKKTACYALKKNIWDTLAELELIKPVMLGKLIEIRNTVEHKFTDPPSQARCIELSEFVWYFLRSTDSISKLVSEGPYLEDSNNSIYYNGNPANEWKSIVTADLSNKLISTCPKADYFEVSEITVQARNEYQQEKLKDIASIKEIKATTSHENNIVITGQLKDRNIELWFLRLYFRAN